MGENGEYGTTLAPPAAAPPQAPPAGTPGAAAPAPRKKRKGCLIALVVAVVLVLLAAIGVALVLGQMAKPDDEEVAYSEADFQSAVAKAGVTWPELPEGADPDDYERIYAGEQPLDAVFTEAELSALMSFNHSSSYWPIKSMQVDLAPGGVGEASAVVSYAGRDWPVSVSGSAAASNSRLDVEFSSAEVAGIDVPAEYLPLGAEFLENVVNARLARIPGLRIDSAEITEEGVHFIGTIWETAEYVEVQ